MITSFSSMADPAGALLNSMQLLLSERLFTYCVRYSRGTALSYDSQSVNIK